MLNKQASGQLPVNPTKAKMQWCLVRRYLYNMFCNIPVYDNKKNSLIDLHLTDLVYHHTQIENSLSRPEIFTNITEV